MANHSVTARQDNFTTPHQTAGEPIFMEPPSPDLDAPLRHVDDRPSLDELIRRAEAPPSFDDAVRRLRGLDRRRRERLLARLAELDMIDALVRETPYGSGRTA
jgi:hypothetical protein